MPSAARRSTRPGSGAGVGRVVDDEDAVDDDRRARAGRIAVRVGVGRAVVEIVRVEDRDVGAPALARAGRGRAASSARAGSAGHLVDRAFERQQPLVAHVAADDAREGAVEARMRHALADDAVIGDAIAVGADERGGRAHDRADVVLADRGDQHAGRAVVGDQMIADAGRSGRRRARRRARRWSCRRVCGRFGEIETCTHPRTGCGPNC